MKNSFLKIRRFRQDDEQEVIRLWRDCGLLVPQNHPKHDIIRKIATSPDLFFVGTLSNKLIATVMAGYDGHRGWINYLAVSPHYRKRGLGRQMMEFAEKELLKIGCPKINLQVRQNNLDVIRFYRAIGYKDDHVVSLGKRLISDPPYKIEQF
ncbi:GNAT family acetyltransferase [candidate division KSB1 bacterium]|nr:GNAT family acetyltransferase [candidate division KSB1 bacterium]